MGLDVVFCFMSLHYLAHYFLLYLHCIFVGYSLLFYPKCHKIKDAFWRYIYTILFLKICSNLHMRLSSRNAKRSNISTYLVSNDLTNIGFITLSSISFISIYADVDRNEQIFLSVCFEWLCAYLISILWFQIVCKQCSI